MVRRDYDNSLRAEQAAATRKRIVDASIVVLAKGPDELSVPAVAAEAGVSVPTVYRHFASKKALVDAVYERYSDEIDVRWPDDPPRNLDDFLTRVPGVFIRQEQLPSTLRAVMSGPTGAKARRDNMPDRLASADALIGALRLDPDDRERLRDLMVVLTSSAIQGAFRDYLGVGPEVAADRVVWAIKRLTTPTTKKRK
ncbi:MAG: hypothetical protein QOC92_1149 [Acidimicrobiaceae bacterium]|jgi:AcrR family transcriptional regulator